MIVKLKGKLVAKKDAAITVDVNGVFYEVLVPKSIMHRIEGDNEENIDLIIYHYFQISPSSGHPILVGFLNEVEKDFFLNFIKVSGIGPRAAVKALNRPISEISQAILAGDEKFLKSLPGIGLQKAKEIIAKLQSKVGKYGLIQDKSAVTGTMEMSSPDWQEEALEILLQLQYKRTEAKSMIEKAFQRSKKINSAEDLLNEIYRQRVNC